MLIENFYTMLVGLFTGFCSGMFGIGGAAIATPLLELCVGAAPLIALASPLPVAIPSAITGSYIYKKNNLIDFKLAGISLISAIPVSLLGTWVSGYCNGKALLVANTVFMMLLALNFFISDHIYKSKERVQRRSMIGTLFFGSLSGFISGLLAVGGGIVLITAFTRYNGLPTKNAMATSLVCVGIISIISSTGHYLLGHIDLWLTFWLCLAAVPMAYLGAKQAIKFKNRTLELLFASMLSVFGLYYIFIHILLGL